MGLCSCTPKCACALHAKVGGNGLVTVTGNGDPAEGGWEIEVGETGWAGTALNGGIVITPGGAFGHGPGFAAKVKSTDTVTMGITADGIEAHVTDAPPGVGGVPTGVSFPFFGDTAPSGYLMQTGPFYAGYVPQVDYPALFAVIGHRGSGGVDPANGTFAVPYLGDKFPAGQGSWGVIGTVGGLAAVALSVAELAAHAHGVSDPTHGHGASSTTTNVAEGTHTHDGAGAHHDFIVESNAPGSFEYLAITATNVDTVGTFRMTSNGTEGGNSKKPNREPLTFPDGAHNHAASTSTSVTAAATGVSILNNGSGQAHENRPPFMVTNYIIKT